MHLVHKLCSLQWFLFCVSPFFAVCSSILIEKKHKYGDRGFPLPNPFQLDEKAHLTPAISFCLL